ncbi:MAG: putative drug resistance efflux protein [Rhodococcus erythropolis]|uniref:MFS transporter n=1 Tax=Rhodococcus erythropolis TaxID=1833 RepID=UPI002167551C|nr:MFS transporter [Rhodococcus erythropolis]MCS4255613.1 MFS family permease [Rhodococcus erythropolis]MCW2429250.1 MFS family permease [Rhodococcus erythropolis]MDF2895220.1 putative drug resistance efflux protein [Rhodococcus erythropolis]
MGDPSRRGFISVLAVLLSTGWAANHFASLIPVLRVDEGLSHTVLDGVFGIYALGLLPGLLTGGAVSDRVGRAVVVLPGALIASLGTLILLLWHDAPGLMVGRLVVGIGAGLAIGAGTAWAADLRGKSGTVMAGVALTSGFALGPLFSGLLAQFAAFPLATPFVVSAVLSVGSVAAAAVWSRTPAPTKAAMFTQIPDRAERSGTGVKVALLWALPLAPWVFASATVSFVTMTARLGDRYSGPLLPGFAAALTLGAGILVQTAARHRNWGPQAGTVGAALAALGYCLVAVGGAHPALGLFIVCALVLGTAYGLCLREGLLDLESLAPPASRGALTGIFYVGTYLGFGLPVLLVVIEPTMGPSLPLVILAAVAAVVAVVRFRRLRSPQASTPHPRLEAASV